MIKIEHTEVVGWKHVIRGMRNPMNSWDKSDSGICGDIDCNSCIFDGCDKECGLIEADYDYVLGKNDHELMMSLSDGGPVHAKYRRMIVVYLDITAPLYWWKEFDTYKVGTVANSCSTMHKIHAKEFTLDDFSHDQILWSDWFDDEPEDSLACVPAYHLNVTVATLNYYRKKFLEANDKLKSKDLLTEAERKHILAQRKKYWWQMIQLLPSSYNQKRTVMLNYEVLVGIYKWRKEHKLDEWREFCKWIESLPYSEIITGEDEDDLSLGHGD